MLPGNACSALHPHGQGRFPRFRTSESVPWRPFLQCPLRPVCCPPCRPSAPSRRSLVPGARPESLPLFFRPRLRRPSPRPIQSAAFARSVRPAASCPCHSKQPVPLHYSLRPSLPACQSRHPLRIPPFPESASASPGIAFSRTAAAHASHPASAGAAICIFRTICREKLVPRGRTQFPDTLAGNPSEFSSRYC